MKRGTLQRQEDLGLGLQSTRMDEIGDEIGTAHGGEGLLGVTTTSVSAGEGPDIPTRSPSRAIRGRQEGYF